MLAGKPLDAMLRALGLLSLILSSHNVWAQAPFISYNQTIPIGQSGLVSWDLNSFAGPVNLWIQELAPNSTAPQVPLDYSNTKGYFAWEAGTNLVPGQYFYQLQVVGGTGVIFKSNPFIIVCSNCPVATSTLAPLTSSTSISSMSYPTTYTGPTTSGPSGTSVGGAITTATAPAPSASSKSSGLSTGAAAGIGVAGAVVAIGIVGLIFWLCRRSRKRKHEAANRQPDMAHAPPPPSMSPPPQFQSHGYYHQEAKPNYDPSAVTSHHSRQWSHELEDPSVSQATQPYGASRMSPPPPPLVGRTTPEMRPRMSPPPNVRQPSEGYIDYASGTAPRTDQDGVIRPEPRRSPPPARDAFNIYPPQASPQLNPPITTPTHTDGSVGLSSQENSPNPETGGEFRNMGGQGSPESQQHLFTRKRVGSPRLGGE